MHKKNEFHKALLHIKSFLIKDHLKHTRQTNHFCVYSVYMLLMRKKEILKAEIIYTLRKKII